MLWKALRNRQLGGYKFRRQHPIGFLIADFYCAQPHLIVEVDGDIHANPDQASYDKSRTAWLHEHGYYVIRFMNRDVFRQLDAVLAEILCTCVALNGKTGEN